MPNIEPCSDLRKCIEQLMEELDRGWRSGEEQGWLTLEEVEKALELTDE